MLNQEIDAAAHGASADVILASSDAVNVPGLPKYSARQGMAFEINHLACHCSDCRELSP
ncbi:hypothetical protein [Diaphorobacter aerolatus]|uniref:Uncharacterized protein n=1 Tax=Diaphorobacter aerolatus TaxID=1288495 RepID=A0A7H0GM80_9BURK|nr:hypothetical protein [Diaphorobacter aerolatus]QNP49396.1 hypothetical protein H9K75_04950 [Diaphorobacter aerolatus]